MRVCLVYDCLFPHTVGGAERWYRNLAERLASADHEVTYITLRQWPRGERADFAGVQVRAVGPRMALYVAGRRRIAPPLVFGLGVLWHLLRHGRRYDVVHTAAFPYFSLLAAGAARRAHGFALIVDWHEVWTAAYWREYLGALGPVGSWVQRRCARVRQRAFCFSRLHARRLAAEGLRGQPVVLEGEYAGDLTPRPSLSARPVVVFAGRHIPEKRVPALVSALAAARRSVPELCAEIYGDGPEREALLRRIAAEGLDEAIEAPGFVSPERVEEALASALCMALPSRREGYGMVVIEAAARGTPSVLVSDPDNAATELVEEGVNGIVAPSAAPADLAAAIVAVHDAGAALRESTAQWFARNSRRLSIDSSLQTVLAAYADADSVRS